MANIRDAEEAILLASTQVEQWRAEFLEEWYMPIRSMIVNVMMSGLNPDQLRELRRLAGEETFNKFVADYDIDLRREDNARSGQ